MKTPVTDLYKLFVNCGDMFQILLLLFFRINWGWQFLVTGQGKLAGHAKVVEFFTTLHLPFPEFTAWFVAGVEFLGGLFLLIGFANRPVGLVLAVNMTVAYLCVDEDRMTLVNFFKEQDPFFQAAPFFFLLTALFAFAFGAGPISADSFIKHLKNNYPGPIRTSGFPTGVGHFF
jgi:putative oxidoreductase